MAVTEVAGAYLVQARSDFAVFQILLDLDRSEVPSCHVLQHLQMAAEKLAKAVLLALEVDGFDRFSHIAFSLLPNHIRRRDIARVLGWSDFRAFRTFLRRTSPLFREIDELHPAVGSQRVGGGGADGPNVEYPWPARDATGRHRCHVPARHTFTLLDRLQNKPDGAAVVSVIRQLLNRFEVAFA